METDQTRHETEESLTLKQFGTHHISNKLQNGGSFSERDSLQNTDNTNWNNHKPNTVANSMKRPNENCNNSESVQGLLDHGSFIINGVLMNGEQLLTEPSFQPSQPKKFRTDSEIVELKNKTEFQCSAQSETKLGNRNCTILNGDAYHLPRNKHASISNGAVLTTSTIESTPGDLLEKTLSQYYPEQVSIAPQRSGPQDAMKTSLTKKMPGEDIIPPALTSEFPNSAQMLNSQTRKPAVSGSLEGSNNYNSVNYIVNGYANHHETVYQQKKQPPQQLSPSSHQGSLQQLPGMAPPPNTANSLQQHKNGPGCFPNSTNPQRTYENGSHNFDHKEHNTHSRGTKAVLDKYGPSNFGIQNIVQYEEPESGHAQQFGIQPNNFQRTPGHTHGADNIGMMGPITQQPHQAGLEKSLDNTSQQTENFMCSNLHQGHWMERNPLQQQTHVLSSLAKQENRDFAIKPLLEQQKANLQDHGQYLEKNHVQRFESPGMFKENIHGSNNIQQQQQLSGQTNCASAQNNNSPDWQHGSSKFSLVQQSQPQIKHDQQNVLQSQQARGHYHTPMQSEHLREHSEVQDVLSPEFFTTQQQHCNLPRPLSHPTQSEEQQLKSPIYRPHSQPQPGQIKLNQQHRNNYFSYNNTTDAHIHHQSQYSPNSGNSDFRQFQPQRPSNQIDLPQTSTQSQPLSPQFSSNQQTSTHMYPKAELQLNPCSQVQRGSQLPLASGLSLTDFQKHAALRNHLLQRQERQGPLYYTQSTNDIKHSLKNVKIDNGPRFHLPGSQEQMGGLQIKQEKHQSLCDNNKKQDNILASMEQSLKQYHLSPVFEKKSFVINSNKVKVESSGPVTILSTNTDMCKMEAHGAATSSPTLKKTPESTPKKEQLLQRFMDSPMKLLDTPIKSLLDMPMKTQYDIASCHCVEQISEKDEGPYYTHLGSAPTVAGIREMMEKRSSFNGQAIRIEKVVYTGKEGKSTQGCPIAKWVIRRASVEEKLLVLVRERIGHKCDTACIIVAILVWEGIQSSLADKLYLELSDTLRRHGALTQRRCALNEERTCACQGLNPDACGASFSFGCSWSMYYNGCKFARSKIPRKFKLLGDDVREEERLEQNFQNLATLLGPLYKNMAPEAYGNQVEHEHRAPDCRLGKEEGRPFSGVTACLDFCAHAHRDLHNMLGGSTVVCTLTREDNREIGKIPEDEQLHVLPLYKASNTDEFGSEEGQQEKIKSGAIQVLSAFRRQVRMLAEPAKSCRQKKLDAKKAAAVKNAMLDNAHDKAEKVTPSKSKVMTCENISQSTHMAGFIPGAIGASQHPIQPTHPFGNHPRQLQQQQHENILNSFPGAANSARYPTFPSHQGSFASTSKPGSIFPPQLSTPASPYPAPIHASTSYIDGSNRSYVGYQCNGGMPLDNYHPYYASNQKHLDMYQQQQQQAFYSEQQYTVHPRFEVNYPPNFGDPGLQINGYNACSMRPVHPMRAFSPCGPNGATDPHFMDPLSRATSVHGGLNYNAAGSNSNQFGRSPNPYLSQSPQMFHPGQQPFHMQIKQEISIASPKMLGAQLTGVGLNPGTQTGLGSHMLSGIKQEPGTPQTLTTPQKPEMWSDNEHNFLDPDIGGVALAPTHGSVLIECAKRELHATTPLKNPDRHHPTRISLVFYQHKNLNEAKHGLVLWEAKMAEKAREKEEDAEKNGGEGTPSKSHRKGTKREHPESLESLVEPPYKRFIQALIEGSSSCTTNTYISTSPYAFTKVTGPYSHFA